MDEYISREEVVKEIKSRIFDADDAWESGYNTAMAGIMEWIEHMPSADVQPVKHGKWESDKCDMPRCSCCSYIPEFNRHIDDYYYSDFCPNCGARMDGDNNG